MSAFWEIAKMGLPALGGLSAFVYARHKGMTPIPQVGLAVGGWIAGYLLYKGAARVSDGGMEALPEEMAPGTPNQLAPPGGVPTLQEVMDVAQPASVPVPTPGIPPAPSANGQGHTTPQGPPAEAPQAGGGGTGNIVKLRAVKGPTRYDPGDVFGTL